MHPLAYRIATLKIYNFLGSMRKTAEALNVSVASICRWSKSLQPKGWPERGTKMLPAMESFMRIALEKEPFLTASYLQSRIIQAFGVQVSRQLVALVLRKKMNYSWKRTRKRGPKGCRWTDEQTSVFKRQLLDAMEHGSLSAWDESSFDQRCRPVYGYSLKGTQSIVNAPRSSIPHKHYSLIMGIHMNGSHHHSLLTGSVKAHEFAEFLESAPYPPGTVVLVDNHSMHKTKLVKQKADEKDYTLLYTPPYSPEYNPIELVFGVIKNYFYKARYIEDVFMSPMDVIVNQCISKTVDNCNTIPSCFRHVANLCKQ